MWKPTFQMYVSKEIVDPRKRLSRLQGTPDDIADIIEFVINRPDHVNIADILVLPQAQATSSIIDKKY